MIQLAAIPILFFLLYCAFKSLRNSGYALAVVWSTYALEQFLQQANSIFVRYGFLVNVGMVVMTLVSLAYGLQSGRIKRLRFSKAHLWFIGLFGFAVVSVGWSIDSTITLNNLKSASPYIFAFCILAPYCAHDRTQINNAINATIYLGGLVLFGMLFCKFEIRSLIITTASGRDLVGNPLAVASYGGYVLTCCGFSLYGGDKNEIRKLLKFAIAGLAVYSIVRSGSRGQLFASLFACMIWLPYTAQVAVKRSAIIGILVCGVFALVAAYFIMGEEVMVNRWSTGRMQRDQSGRFELAGEVLEVSYDKGPMAWIFGMGSSASYAIIGVYPHFVPGEILAEEGFVGLILFGGFLGCAGLLGVRALKLSSLEVSSRVNMGAMLSLFTFQFLLCLKQGSMLGSPALFSLGLCIALSAERSLALSRRRLPMPHPVIHPSQQFNARGY